jgi:xanthine dehydrogenase accessory factor
LILGKSVRILSVSQLITTTLPIILIRGGGDLASGVALRLNRAGMKVVITELPKPLAVRRLVSFSEAVYQGEVEVEGVMGISVQRPEEAIQSLKDGQIPVIVDPECSLRHDPLFDILAVIDARMTKRSPDLGMDAARLVIGLGPGFEAGKNCHAVIETKRGHSLGRVIWTGPAETDTGIPGKVGGRQHDRILRAPSNGKFRNLVKIGSFVEKGQVIATVEEETIVAPFDGLLRGLLPDQFTVIRNIKIGDLDPRMDSRLAVTVSDKSLSVAGGVLEALLSQSEIRAELWS